MPATEVLFYQDDDKSVPVLDWLNSLRERNERMAKTTTDAVTILKHQSGIDPETDPTMLQIAEGFRIAQMVYDARKAAGLTQVELAEAVGTTQSVISQLEDAEYDGHSLSMLRRIADALGSKVEIRIVPKEPVA